MGSEVEVTAADREKAAAMYDSWFIDGDRDDEIVADIAQALADERAKARAPFLALADVLDGEWHEDFADRIRRAAQDPPEVSET